MSKNKEKFDLLKSYNLPFGHYVIVGSGPLGIRNLREINDIDLCVSQELWQTLASQYGVTDEDDKKKILLANGLISVFPGESDPEAPSTADRIAKAEIIEGLPFESLEHLIYFKTMWGREKDKKDIQLINAILN